MMTESGAGTSSSSLAVMALNDTKAGMTGLDKAKINAIIEEASKGSKFYAAKLKSQERIDAQVQKIQAAKERIHENQLHRAVKDMNALAEEYERTRDLSRTIVHVDMDMYYAAVEMLDDPKLASVPMAVGGMGMLSTSNYLARKFGVRAGMPGFIGKKLCPDLVLVKQNFDRYREISEVVRNVFREYDPNFCPMSLDEAYLDLTDYLATKGESNPESTVVEIRAKIQDRTQLTASAGIAPNARLAKVCSDLNKPNGQYYLKPDLEEIRKFVRELPIRKVGGIGNVTEQMLKAVGVMNCEDLFEQRGYLKLLFSEVSYTSFLRIALGIGETHLGDWTERDRKSLSNERTFRDTADPKELFEILKHLCQELSGDLEKESREGRAVSVKIKTHNFKIKTKVMNLFEYTSDAAVIELAAKKILRQLMEAAEEKPLKLRLMGVRMAEFRSEESLGTGEEHHHHQQQQTTIHSFLSRAKEKKVGDEFTAGGSTEERVSSSSSSSPAAALKSFPCPICEREIRAQNENLFNTHLDRCLKEAEASSAQQSSGQRPPEKRRRKSSGEKGGEEEEEVMHDLDMMKNNTAAAQIESEKEKETNVEDTGESFASSAAPIPSIQDAASAEEKLEDITNKSGSADDSYSVVSCPVCEKDIITSSSSSEIDGEGERSREAQINKHVDECLNRKQIRTLLSSESTTSKKRKPSQSSPDDICIGGGKKKVRNIQSYFEKRMKKD